MTVKIINPLPKVHVAVGVIIDRDNRILISKRHDHLHMGGRWEFPGGKLDEEEDVQRALARELLEELSIDVKASAPLIVVEHDYGEKVVLLDVWWVHEFAGEPHGAEGQEVRWVGVQELGDYQFPDANAPIVTAVQKALA